MSFTDNYTTLSREENIKIKNIEINIPSEETQKIILSEDAYAIGSMIEQLIFSIENAGRMLK